MTDLHDETDKSPSGSPKVEEKSDELLNGTSENEERPVENGDVSEKEEPKAETKKEEDEDEPKEKVRNGKSKEREYDEDNRPWSNNKKNKLDHLNIRREVSNRVKLYVLVDQRVWDDRGTGHVTCVKAPEDIDDEDASPANASNFVVIVRLESHDKNMLESRILMDTVYQKQQDTLIVWSESESCDLALSFQDKSGCEDIWSKICEVQGRDPADYDAGLEDQEESEPASDLTMPPISVSRLSEVDGLITLHLSSSSMREAMAATMEKEDNMKQLRSTFEMCEDLEHTEGLKLCYSIAKNLFMLNRSSLNDLLINDRNLRHVLGMLEYDPAFPERRKHREFVFEKAKMREVLPISDPELKQKIEKTYRIQYIQDVCLPSMGLFDENLLSVLNSSIFFNRIDIINQLQKDKKLMKELFESLKKEDTSTERRKELVLFLKEFINLHHGLPGNGIQSKENFFKTIMNYDILGTLDPCMKSEDPEIRSTIIDVLSIVVEFTPEGVREHLLKQAKGKSDEDILINRMLRHMLTDRDPDNTSGMQVALILKILFDPENMSTLKSEKNEFLNMFYQRSVRVLTQPLMDNVEGGVIHRDDFVSATRAASVVRLLSFCIEHHPVSMRTYCISTDLLNKFLVLLKSKHKFLSIHALKLLRKVISVKDENYNKYIVREKVLEQVFECFKKNGTRYNLLNSAILQLFDFIKTEDIKPLIKYIVETHPEVIDSVKYVKVFHDLRVKYDQHKDREETMSIRSNETNGSPKSYRKERLEEHWFEEDDEDVFNDTVIGPQLPSPKKKAAEKEETNGSNGSASSSRKTGMELMFPSLVKRKQPVDDEDAAVFGGSGVSNINYEKKIVIKMGTGEKSKTPSPASSPRASPGPSRDDEVSSSQSIKEPSPAPTIRSLVDYDESDSDEDDDQSSVPSSSTGSPEKEKPIEHKKSVDSPEHDDVSSTSGEEKEEELTTPTPSDDDDSMCQKRKRKSSSPPDSEKSETLTVKRTRIEETSQA